MATRNANCSFCRKNYRDVGPLVEGPGDVYICGECVELCQAIIDQEKRRGLSRADNPQTWPDPEVVGAALDRIGGLSADIQATLIRAALNHYADGGHAQWDAVLLVGPSRSSRLYAARALAHALEVPVGEADQARIAESMPSQFLLGQLLSACDLDLKVAERGIIYIEIGDDPTTQQRTAELWDRSMRDPTIEQIGLDLTRILFVSGGTFRDLTAETGITTHGRHPDPAVTAEALGMVPALAGGIRAVVRVPALEEVTLARLVPCIDFGRLVGDDTPGAPA
jgi:ATP-dependent protease Clp ATPase subunit